MEIGERRCTSSAAIESIDWLVVSTAASIPSDRDSDNRSGWIFLRNTRGYLQPGRCLTVGLYETKSRRNEISLVGFHCGENKSIENKARHRIAENQPNGFPRTGWQVPRPNSSLVPKEMPKWGHPSLARGLGPWRGERADARSWCQYRWPSNCLCYCWCHRTCQLRQQKQLVFTAEKKRQWRPVTRQSTRYVAENIPPRISHSWTLAVTGVQMDKPGLWSTLLAHLRIGGSFCWRYSQMY